MILNKEFVKRVLGYSGYTVARLNVEQNPQHTRPITYKHFLDLYFSMVTPSEFFFVQLGANDGKTRDPMHEYITKYKLPGILVEPQKDIFEKLKKTYEGYENLSFANVAIAEKDGVQPLYQVKSSHITAANFFEATAISSLDREVFRASLKKRIGNPKPSYRIEPVSSDLADYEEESFITTVTFDTFVKQYGVKKIDLLFMDCDGSDHKILNMFDFGTFEPKLINYESKVLTDASRIQCEKLLESKGYQLFRDGNDTCAFRV